MAKTAVLKKPDDILSRILMTAIVSISLVFAPLPRTPQNARAQEAISLAVLEGVFLSVAVGAAIYAVCHGASKNEAIETGVQKVIDLNRRTYALAATVLAPILLKAKVELEKRIKFNQAACVMPRMFSTHELKSSVEMEAERAFGRWMNSPFMKDLNSAATGLFVRYGVLPPSDLPWTEADIIRIDQQTSALLKNPRFLQEFQTIGKLFNRVTEDAITLTWADVAWDKITQTWNCMKDPKNFLYLFSGIGHMIVYPFYVLWEFVEIKSFLKDQNPTGLLFVTTLAVLVLSPSNPSSPYRQAQKDFKKVSECLKGGGAMAADPMEKTRLFVGLVNLLFIPSAVTYDLRVLSGTEKSEPK